MLNQALELTITRIALGMISFAHGYFLKVENLTIYGTIGYLFNYWTSRNRRLPSYRGRNSWKHRLNPWRIHSLSGMDFTTKPNRCD